jgi:transcriptional regulator NrdR family protein
MESIACEGKPMRWKELDTISERILDRMDRARETEVASEASGHHTVLEGAGLYGTALIDNNRTMHLSAFAEV